MRSNIALIMGTHLRVWVNISGRERRAHPWSQHIHGHTEVAWNQESVGVIHQHLGVNIEVNLPIPWMLVASFCGAYLVDLIEGLQRMRLNEGPAYVRHSYQLPEGTETE